MPPHHHYTPLFSRYLGNNFDARARRSNHTAVLCGHSCSATCPSCVLCNPFHREPLVESGSEDGPSIAMLQVGTEKNGHHETAAKGVAPTVASRGNETPTSLRNRATEHTEKDEMHLTTHTALYNTKHSFIRDTSTALKNGFLGSVETGAHVQFVARSGRIKETYHDEVAKLEKQLAQAEGRMEARGNESNVDGEKGRRAEGITADVHDAGAQSEAGTWCAPVLPDQKA